MKKRHLRNVECVTARNTERRTQSVADFELLRLRLSRLDLRTGSHFFFFMPANIRELYNRLIAAEKPESLLSRKPEDKARVLECATIFTEFVNTVLEPASLNELSEEECKIALLKLKYLRNCVDLMLLVWKTKESRK